MRARVHQPRGPRLYRWLAYVPSLLLLGFAAIFGSFSLFLVTMMMLPLTPVLLSVLGRLLPRSAHVEVGAGAITIRRRGVPAQIIRGKQLAGASTAQLAEGVALSLDTGKEAITLELESEAEADAVRQALGAGHDGFGQVHWFTRPEPLRVLSLAGVAASAASVAIAQMLPPLHSAFALLVALGVMGGMIAPLLLLITLPLLPPRIVLRAEGVAVFGHSGARRATPSSFHPWNHIHHAQERKGKLVIVFVNGRELHVDRRSWPIDWRGMTRAQRRHVVAQINSAARRARGRGKPRPTVAEELEQLAESTVDARTWLARIEAAAERMRADVGYYRGSTIAGEDLWAALENHDAPTRVRATAARLLARVETDATSRERIARAVGSVREPATQQRIRIAIGDDLEKTAQETEALEAAEAERKRSAAGERRAFIT